MMNLLLLILIAAFCFVSPVFAQHTNRAIRAYAVHPTMDLFVTGDANGKIGIHDGSGVEKRSSLIKSKITSIAFSGDKILASGRASLHFLEVVEGIGIAEKDSVPIFDGSLIRLKFSPAGGKVVGISPNGNEPYLVEFGGGKVMFHPIPFAVSGKKNIFSSGAAYASLAVFGKSEDEIWVCAFDGSLVLYDSKTKKALKKKSKFHPIDLLFINDEKIATVLKDSSIAVFDAKNFKKTASLKTGLVFENARIHYVGDNTLILSTPDAEIVWEIGDKKFKKKDLKGITPSECGKTICVKQISERRFVVYKTADFETARMLDIP